MCTFTIMVDEKKIVSNVCIVGNLNSKATIRTIVTKKIVYKVIHLTID